MHIPKHLAALSLACFSFSALANDIDAGLKRIEHIVVIYAENRSFDNLYGLFPGADGIAQATPSTWTQTDHNDQPLPHLPPVWNDKSGQFKAVATLPNRPFRIDAPPFNQALDIKTPDLVHRYYRNIEQINAGRLDRYAALSDAGGLAMGYYDGSTLPMWQYAKTYVLADHFFMGAFGGSFINHFWLICACTPTFPNAPDNLKVQLDSSGKLKRREGSPDSVLAGAPLLHDNELTPDGYAVNTVQPPYQPSRVPPAPGGDPRYADPVGHPLPPQTALTIGDTLTAKGIAWAWYAGAWDAGLADGMQASDAKRKVIYSRQTPSIQTHHQPFNYFLRYALGTPERAKHLKDGVEFLKAIEAGTLPAVAFYKPESSLNQHPGYADILSGDIHIAQVIAKIQASPLWLNTVIIVTYDENGGFWDHVAPPTGPGWGDRWGPGTRIPAIIVSPFAKRGYIDSTPYDTTSILKFITRRFGLAALPGVRRNAGDLSNAFDFGRR